MQMSLGDAEYSKKSQFLAGSDDQLSGRHCSMQIGIRSLLARRGGAMYRFSAPR